MFIKKFDEFITEGLFKKDDKSLKVYIVDFDEAMEYAVDEYNDGSWDKISSDEDKFKLLKELKEVDYKKILKSKKHDFMRDTLHVPMNVTDFEDEWNNGRKGHSRLQRGGHWLYFFTKGEQYDSSKEYFICTIARDSRSMYYAGESKPKDFDKINDEHILKLAGRESGKDGEFGKFTNEEFFKACIEASTKSDEKYNSLNPDKVFIRIVAK